MRWLLLVALAFGGCVSLEESKRGALAELDGRASRLRVEVRALEEAAGAWMVYTLGVRLASGEKREMRVDRAVWAKVAVGDDLGPALRRGAVAFGAEVAVEGVCVEWKRAELRKEARP